MMSYFRYLLLWCLFFCFTPETFAGNEISTILERHHTFLLQEKIEENEIKSLLQNFNKSDQRWTDINYGDGEKAKWKVSEHLKNIKTLSLSWANPSSRFFKDSKIYNVIIAGLNNWTKNKYQNPNWWHNEIGIPQFMRDILVLMKDTLSQHQLDNYLPILNQYRISGNGANLVWSADLGLYYGLFTKNFKLIDSAVSIIIQEINISEGDGLKPDFSFHQHGQRLQMYQYGAAFLLDNIRIGWELKQSRWAYPENKIELLTSMLLEGWQWMARGIYTVPETMDRSATRKDELNKADVRLYINLFKDLVPHRLQELIALENRQNNKGESLHGFRHFPYSDFTVYHNENFSFFLKTISSRTLTSESINNENLKGKLMNSGETYYMQDGSEYFNMMPVWDWSKLPGITSFTGAEKIVRKDFNGSISGGDIGFTSTSFMLTDKEGNRSVSGKKSWYNYLNYVLCIISDIEMDKISQAYTILDQSRWSASISTNRDIVYHENQEINEYKWIRHKNFIYFPLNKKMRLQLFADTVSGSWNSINAGYSTKKIHDKVFMPSIIHHPEKSAKAYVVAYTANKNPKKIIRNHPFSILKNENDCQAVLLNGKDIAVTFFRPGKIVVKNKKIQVDKPCLVLIQKGKIYLSDPLHNGGKLNIIYNNKQYEVNLPPNGTTISVSI